jgi:hypothetical protein
LPVLLLPPPLACPQWPAERPRQWLQPVRPQPEPQQVQTLQQARVLRQQARMLQQPAQVLRQQARMLQQPAQVLRQQVRMLQQPAQVLRQQVRMLQQVLVSQPLQRGLEWTLPPVCCSVAPLGSRQVLSLQASYACPSS